MNTVIEKTDKGVIKNAQFIARGDRHWVEGNVYGNPFFADGTYIHTSRIVEVNGTRIETLNSFYTCEFRTDAPVRLW
ncbi:hypothetical protein [Xanthomonas phage BUDD]|nr:hypothetical protein [Xanthomonas phage BUDD]